MSWMCKDDRDYSNPISIKGKSSWEDNCASQETVDEHVDSNVKDKDESEKNISEVV